MSVSHSESVTGRGLRTDRVIDAAGRLFVAKGYSATTMSDIASSVGILPGSLYHHFDSKEDAAVQLLERLNSAFQPVVHRLNTSDFRQQDPEHQLQTLAREVARLSYEHAAAVRLRAFDPPSSTGDQIAHALNYNPKSLGKMWAQAATAYTKSRERSTEYDSIVLAQFLQNLTFKLSASSVPKSRGDEAALVCTRLIIDGVAEEHRSAADLDSSEALTVAKSRVKAWSPNIPAADDVTATLLETACMEFAKRGYGSTTIRDIANSSGITMGTIYRRISSMDELFTAISSHYHQQMEMATGPVFELAEHDPVAALDALSHVMTMANKKLAYETKMLILDWMRPGQHLIDAQRDHVKAVERRADQLTEVLRIGVRQGSLALPAPPEVVSPLLRNLLWEPATSGGLVNIKRTRGFIRRHLLRVAPEG